MIRVHIPSVLIKSDVECTPFLAPILPKLFSSDFRYEEWLRNGGDIIRVVDNCRDADISIIPHNLSEYLHGSQVDDLLKDIVAENISAGKVTWGFLWSDLNDSIDILGLRIFRTGGYASKSSAREEGMPSFCNDLRSECLEDPDLNFGSRQKLSVSFCGNAVEKKGLFSRLLRGNSPDEGEVGRELRRRAIKALIRSPLVDCDFEMFDSFFVGDNNFGKDEKEKRRRLFVANMHNSNYALVVRGTGNYSYRHYEAMSLGRIPLFVDSDCLLPLRDMIEWSEVMCIVPACDVLKSPSSLQHFDKSLENYEERSAIVRSTWERYLTPHGFFKAIISSRSRRALDIHMR